MARFCTKCGTGVEAAHRFCDQCGAPLNAVAASAPAPARPRLPALRLPGTRAQRLRACAIGAVLLVAGGAAGWYLLRDEPLPAAAEVEALLPDAIEADKLRCLDNFDYAKDPVQIATYDVRTRALLDLLVTAGIYQGPAELTQQEGFFRRDLLEYRHAEAAARYIEGRRLCFAEGVALDRVDFGPRIASYRVPVVSATLNWRLRNPAAWSTSEAAAAASPAFRRQQHGSVELMLKHEQGKWSVMAPAERAELMHALQQEAGAARQGGSPFGAGGFTALFSGNPGKPLFGRWRSENPFFAASFEFREDSMLVNDQITGRNIRYTREDNEILVSDEEGHAPLRVRIESDERIAIDLKGERITLQRVN